MELGVTGSSSPRQTAPERGRPRRADVERLVCDSALQLAATTGYAGATIDQIADDSGVSKSTIYRSWRSKELLYVRAAERQLGQVPDPDPGESTEDVVRAAVQWFVSRLLLPGMAAALAGVFAESAVDTELRREVVARLRDPHASAFAERVGAPADRFQLVVDLVVGAVLHHYGVTGGAYGEADAERLVRIITRTFIDDA